ncbi:MAG: DsbA family protein [Nitrospira sp.]|nr:DsbA family protein [Nitrospira sp.]
MGKIRAEYFTDPLCSWSWGNEPHYRKLREEFGDQIQWRHRLGGLIKRWSGNSKEMARHQEESSLKTQMPIDASFWIENPPASSHPACIAVKAAGLQGADFEDAYLRRVREGFLTEKRQLDNKEALLKLSGEIPGISIDRLRMDIDSDAAKQAFQEDWEAARNPVPEARDTTVTEGRLRYSFPALLLTNDSDEYRILDGDNIYVDYLTAIKELAPEIKRGTPSDVETFVRKYRHVATKEVSVVCDISYEKATDALKKLRDARIVRKRPVGHFCMWEYI